MAEYTDLDQALANPTDVTELDLSHNELESLPGEIGQLTNLTHLDLSRNEELDWADTFNKLSILTNLTELDLSSNSLESLPSEIGQLTNLTELYLYENNLKISDKKVENISEFLSDLTDRQLPEQERQLYVCLYLQDLEQVQQIAQDLSLTQILPILNDTDKDIRSLVSILLSKQTQPFAESFDPSSSVFYFAGRFSSVKVAEVKKKLKEVGARVVTKLTDQVTHCAVGQGKGEVGVEAHQMEIQLVFDSHLQQLMQLLEQPFLMEEEEDQSELVSNLRQLLTSQDPSNIKVGLQTMLGNGIPSDLLTLATSLYLYHQDTEIRKIAGQAFRKYAPSEVSTHVRSIWKASMRNVQDREKQLDNIISLCDIDGLSSGQVIAEVFGKEGRLRKRGLDRLDEVELGQLVKGLSTITNLTSLDLGSNNLTDFPSEIGQLTNLTHLDLRYNELSSLPGEIGQLTNLQQLNLGGSQYSSGNDLTELPVEIGQLANLTQLNLSRNNLTELPVEIGQLTNLTKLDLSRNNLTELSASIGQLTNLTELYLLSNEKLDWADTFNKLAPLTNLTKLDLSYNKLETLPVEIGQLTNLTSLELRYNELSSLPGEIGQLANLTSLELGWNKELDWADTFNKLAPLTNLTELYLSYNELESLPSEIGQLKNLAFLELYGTGKEKAGAIKQLLPNCEIEF